MANGARGTGSNQHRVVGSQPASPAPLADGFHRVYAAEAAGLAEIVADVRSGTRRDALFHSLSANALHGYRRTTDDKRRAIDVMLNDPEWARWSDSEVARQIGVSHTTVASRRPSGHSGKIADTRLVNRGGSTFPMNTANIGSGAPTTSSSIRS